MIRSFTGCGIQLAQCRVRSIRTRSTSCVVVPGCSCPSCKLTNVRCCGGGLSSVRLEIIPENPNLGTDRLRNSYTWPFSMHFTTNLHLMSYRMDTNRLSLHSMRHY